MTRLLQIEKDSVSGIVTADGVTYYPYQQETLPYWTNQITGLDYVREWGEDIEVRVYTIQARLILAHTTQDYRGETASRVYEIIPAVQNYIEDRRFLNSTVDTDPLDGVFEGQGFHGAEITAVNVGQLVNAGLPTGQIAVIFTIRLPLLHERY